MPKLICPCGYMHDLSPIPDAGWITIGDDNYEALIAAEAAAAPHDQLSPGEGEPERTFTRMAGLLYECPACARAQSGLLPNSDRKRRPKGSPAPVRMLSTDLDHAALTALVKASRRCGRGLGALSKASQARLFWRCN